MVRVPNVFHKLWNIYAALFVFHLTAKANLWGIILLKVLNTFAQPLFQVLYQILCLPHESKCDLKL